jgi:hypothetical protein
MKTMLHSFSIEFWVGEGFVELSDSSSFEHDAKANIIKAKVNNLTVFIID